MPVFEVGGVVHSAYLPLLGDIRALLGLCLLLVKGPQLSPAPMSWQVPGWREGVWSGNQQEPLLEGGPEDHGSRPRATREVGSLQTKLARLTLRLLRRGDRDRWPSLPLCVSHRADHTPLFPCGPRLSLS